jgi:hypothetical protein
MAILTVASLNSMTPLFFIQGVGPTLLQQLVLGTADILFFSPPSSSWGRI